MHADRQAVVRMASGNRCSGKSRQVEPLREAHGFEVAGAGFVVASTVEKRGAGRNRRKQNRRVMHLAKNFGAEKVALGTGFEELFESEGFGRTGDGKIFAQDGTDLGFVAVDAIANHVAYDGAEENPPELERAVEAGKTEGLDLKALGAEKLGSARDGGACFRSGLPERIAFQNADGMGAQFCISVSAKRDGRGESVAGIRAGHHVKKLANVRDGSSHGTNDGDPGECACAGRKMSGCRDAAGSRLQSTNATKVRRDADGAAAVAADSTNRAAGGDGGRFAATGAPGGVSEVPRIAGFSNQKIVGFVGHQEFGGIGVAEKNGASRFQPGDERGVLGGDVVFAKKRAGGAGPARDVDATLDGKRDTVKRPKTHPAHEGGFGGASLKARALFVEMHEGVELGLARPDALEMSVEYFDRRKFL